MKKILFVIDSLGCGGAEKSLVSLLPLLNSSKYKIYLWIRTRGGIFEEYIPNNVTVIDQPQYIFFEKLFIKLSHWAYSLCYRFNTFFNIKEHLAESLWKCSGRLIKAPTSQFDIAIAYQQGLPTYIVAEKIHAKKKIAWINADIFSAGYNVVYNKQFYDKIDVLVPVSKKLENILKERYIQYEQKFHCVYDIINPQLVLKLASESIPEIIHEDNKTVLITTGRLAKPKNHILAVHTANELKKRNIPFKWYFIGEGNERNNIEIEIHKYNLEDEVVLLGLKTNPYPYMIQSDIYVQTSSFEGFGMTIAEAKILKKPIVSTNFEVIHDQLTHERNGLISEMSPVSLADNIERMITDTKLRLNIIAELDQETNSSINTEIHKVEQILDEN